MRLVLDDYSWERDWVHRILNHGRKAVTSAFRELGIDTKIMSDSPAGTIIDASASTVGHLAGSVAAQIAAHAHASVIVVRGTDGSLPDPAAAGRVVVGLDGSDESQRARAFGVDEVVGRGGSIGAVYGWCTPDAHGIEPFINRTYNLEERRQKRTGSWPRPCPAARIDTRT